MAEEEYDFDSYRNLSELKKELEGSRGKKEISQKDLYDAVQQLTQTINEMVDIFAAASEQMKLDEKSYESDAKKHEAIVSKLDRILNQNKDIAHSIVAVVDMFKEKSYAPEEKIQEPLFKQKEAQEPQLEPQDELPFFKQKEHPIFMKPQQAWQPKPQPMMSMAEQPMAHPQIFPPMMPPPKEDMIPPEIGMPDFGAPPMPPTMPPMEPSPSPNLELPEELMSPEEPKKKSIFGMFKK